MMQASHPREFERAPMIDVREPAAVRYWTERLNCTPSALREAIDEVGPSAVAVEEYLAEGED